MLGAACGARSRGSPARAAMQRAAARSRVRRLVRSATLENRVSEWVTIAQRARGVRCTGTVRVIEAAQAHDDRLATPLHRSAIRAVPPEPAATTARRCGVVDLRWPTYFRHGHLDRQTRRCSDFLHARRCLRTSRPLQSIASNTISDRDLVSRCRMQVQRCRVRDRINIRASRWRGRAPMSRDCDVDDGRGEMPSDVRHRSHPAMRTARFSAFEGPLKASPE